jgi:hypothetical protein
MGLESVIRRKNSTRIQGGQKSTGSQIRIHNTGCENFRLKEKGGGRPPCEARQGGGRARLVVGPVPSTGQVRLARHRRIQRLSRLT